MYNRQTLLLMLALICDPFHGHDKKQRKKLILKLLPKVNPQLKKVVLKAVLDAPDMVAEIYFHVNYHLDLIDITNDLAIRKFDGMVIVDNCDVYPIKIRVPDAIERCGELVGAEYLQAAEQELLEDRIWIPQNQELLGSKCVKRCSVMVGSEDHFFEVGFFSTRGFKSGRTPYVFEKKSKSLLDNIKTA